MISVPWQCGQCRTCIIMTSLDWVEGCSDSRTPEEHSRPTPLKHLRIFQEKRTPTPQETLPAPVALLAFRRRAMAHNIRALAVGTMQHLGDHGTSTQSW